MEDMHEAVAGFWGRSRAYIMVGPREEDGQVGVRFGGSENDLRYMFQEIGTYLYQASVISEEQWRAACLKDRKRDH